MSVYNPTVWVDYETPVNALNLNKSEAGIQQQSTDISVLSEYVSALDNNLNNDIGALSGYVAELDTKLTEDITTLSDFVTTLDDKVDKVEAGKSVHVGADPPTSDAIEVWIDTTNVVEITSNIQDSIIDEFRSAFKFMQAEIVSLREKNAELEYRLSYIEQNGGGVAPPPDTTESTTLTFEDGSKMTFEDGSIMIFEKVEIQATNTLLTFEDGTKMLFEDNSYMTFGSGEGSSITGTALTFEDNSIMTFENNDILIFEQGVI